MAGRVRVDVIAGEPQMIDHTAPVYLALPPEVRGDYIVRRSSAARTREAPIARAERRGVAAVADAKDKARPVLVTSYGDHKYARLQGRKRIVRMEHGIGQSFVGSSHPSYAGGSDAQDVGLFLCPNEHSAARWRAAYPAASVEVVGCPKLDGLPRKPDAGRTVALSFHWSHVFSRDSALTESSGSFEEYRSAVTHLAQHYRVLGHGHPRTIDKLAPHYRRAGIRLVRDFEDVCRLADVYVCDTNSTIYEFASTGRPVVVVNGSHFRKDVEHGLRFWEASGVGVNCDHPSELVAAVEEALDDDLAQRNDRERALDMVYAYRTGAAKRAADAIVEWMS